MREKITCYGCHGTGRDPYGDYEFASPGLHLCGDCHGTGKALDRRQRERRDLIPIDMLLYCPRCSAQHVDKPQPEKDWTNPPHRSHECQACHHVWRPADVPTNGVAEIKTQGKLDGSPSPVGARYEVIQP